MGWGAPGWVGLGWVVMDFGLVWILGWAGMHPVGVDFGLGLIQSGRILRQYFQYFLLQVEEVENRVG